MKNLRCNIIYEKISGSFFTSGKHDKICKFRLILAQVSIIISTAFQDIEMNIKLLISVIVDLFDYTLSLLTMDVI